MSKNLDVKLSEKNGTWEATVSIPGTKATKLVQKSTGLSQFATRAAALNSARSLAKTLGFSGISFRSFEENRVITDQAPLAVAAKKSVSATKTKSRSKKAAPARSPQVNPSQPTV